MSRQANTMFFSFFVCVCLAYYQHGESDLYLQTYIYFLAGKWINFSTDSVDRRFFNFWVDLSMGQNQVVPVGSPQNCWDLSDVKTPRCILTCFDTSPFCIT